MEAWQIADDPGLAFKDAARPPGDDIVTIFNAKTGDKWSLVPDGTGPYFLASPTLKCGATIICPCRDAFVF
jgi:hypothetical protein